MTEIDLENKIKPVMSIAMEKISLLESIIQKAEQKQQKLEHLADALEKRSAVIDQGADSFQAEAFAVIDEYLDPVGQKINHAQSLLDAMSFTVVSPEDIKLGSTDNMKDVTDLIDVLAGQVPDVTEDIQAAFETDIDDVSTKKDELTRVAFDALDDTTGAVDNLIEMLSENIPDTTNPVSLLIEDEFGTHLMDMASKADNLLSDIERLVEAGTAAIDSGIGDIMDLLEQINDIVQPLEPAFDAFEMLR